MSLAACKTQQSYSSSRKCAPTTFDNTSISIVIPVRDDHAGIHRIIKGLMEIVDSIELVREITVVDDGSKIPITIPPLAFPSHIRVKILRTDGRGPAVARNLGCSHSTGEWILFLDADCVPTVDTISGFANALNGSIAFAGNVRSLGTDPLSRYYESQQILVPPPGENGQPQYLVTANALVWKWAFDQAGSFNERFPFAGGEDIDLAYRLRDIGSLSYAPGATVLHDFSDGITGFWRRFVRYGRGNRLLATMYQREMTPTPFKPIVNSSFNRCAAALQYIAMKWGYTKEE